MAYRDVRRGSILLAVLAAWVALLIAGPSPVQAQAAIAHDRSATVTAARHEPALERSQTKPHHPHKKRKHHDEPSGGNEGPDFSTPFRWSPKTIAAAIAAATCALLANAAGIGGGPFYVPLFNSVLGFDLKLCTGLSHSVVATGAIGSCIYGLIQRSPVDRRKTLLNFDIALTLIPAMLFGVSFGVLLNPLTPEWLQTALLSVLLVIVVRKTYAKGFKQLREEKKASEQSHNDEDHSIRESLLEGGAVSDVADPRRKWRRAVSLALDKEGVDEHYSSAHIEEKPHASAAELVHEAEAWLVGFARRVPWLKALMLLVLWAAFLKLQLAKAQHNNCTLPFAVAAAGQAVMLGLVTVAFVYYQSRLFSRDPNAVDSELRKMMTTPLSGGGNRTEDGGEDFSHGPKNLVVVTSVVAVSGFIAGLLGIGGALIFNPFLLALGVQPQVVASTAVLIILFGSSSIALSFLFQSMLNTSYVKVFAPIAFVSSLIGVTAIGWLVRKSGRASIIVLLMATVIAAGTVATVVFGGIRSYHDIQEGHIGFKSFCET